MECNQFLIRNYFPLVILHIFQVDGQFSIYFYTRTRRAPVKCDITERILTELLFFKSTPLVLYLLDVNIYHSTNRMCQVSLLQRMTFTNGRRSALEWRAGDRLGLSCCELSRSLPLLPCLLPHAHRNSLGLVTVFILFIYLKVFLYVNFRPRSNFTNYYLYMIRVDA